MISRRIVLRLGVAQLVSWGISYYLIGAVGEFMRADLGWSRETVYGGFSIALVTMGFASPVAGRLIDRYGGRHIMMGGSGLCALSCVLLASAHSLSVYYTAWLCLGIAMRLTLYDAAFATLARIGGSTARRSMAHVTLLGGLASTIFWPFGHILAQWFGWRTALLIYAVIAALNVTSYAAIGQMPSDPGKARPSVPIASALAGNRRERIVAGALYALVAMLVGFLNSAMAAHMTSILAALGFASASVWIAGLRGIGQSTARLGEVLFGGRLSPLTLNLLAAALLPAGFIVGLGSPQQPAFAIAFALLIGAGIGLMSITRGTVPLVLFDHGAYGVITGSLLTPSFFVAAAAPVIYAWVIQHTGGIGALYLSAVLALLALGAAGVLRYFFGPQLAAVRRDK